MDYPAFHPSHLHGVQLKDQELVAWLDKKLGDTQDIWTCRSAASFLSQAMIGELETCFQSLETHVKLKIVMGFALLNPRHLNNWKTEINNLLELCMKDPDEWIEMISDMFRQLAPTGAIALGPANNAAHYNAIEEELHDMISFYVRKNPKFELIPTSHQTVSHDAIKQVFGISELKITKHFNLKKRTPSAQLKNDVLKSIEEQSVIIEQQKKGIITSNLPIRIRSTLRKPDEKLPMRAIPSQGVTKISGGFTNEPKKFQRTLSKREGGAKLIAIDDIPQAIKRRKKDEEDEMKKKSAADREALRRKANEDKKEARRSAMAMHEQNRRAAEQQRQERIQQSRAGGVPITPIPVKKDDPLETKESSPPPSKGPLPKKATAAIGKPVLRPLRAAFKSDPARLDEEVDERLSPIPTTSTASALKSEDDMAALMLAKEEAGEAASAAAAILNDEKMNQPPATPAPNFHLKPSIQVNSNRLAQKARELAIKKQCQEMLRTANRLDIGGQQMVIAFMSGNKNNPRPELGNVITLKLSEGLDTGMVDNQLCRLRVETFFQMDYSNGEWKRLRKCKVIDPTEERMYLTQYDPPIQQLSEKEVENCIEENVRIAREDAEMAQQQAVGSSATDEEDAPEAHAMPPTALPLQQAHHSMVLPAGAVLMSPTGSGGGLQHAQQPQLQSTPPNRHHMQQSHHQSPIMAPPARQERKLTHLPSQQQMQQQQQQQQMIITTPPGQQPTLRQVVQMQMQQHHRQTRQPQGHQQPQHPPAAQSHYEQPQTYQLIQLHPSQIVQMQGGAQQSQQQAYIIQGTPISPGGQQTGYTIMNGAQLPVQGGMRLVLEGGQYIMQQAAQPVQQPQPQHLQQHVGIVRTQQPQQYMR